MGELSVLLVLIVGLFFTLGFGVKIVPQGNKWIVQRLGKYHCTLDPGLHFIIPFFDTVAYKVTTKDIVLEIPEQEVITRDNAVILANAVAYINISQPDQAVYGVENYRIAIQTLVQTTLRSIIGEMALDDSLSSREQIKARLKEAIAKEVSVWGINLKTVEIQDIKPSPTMQEAMEAQAAAERARRATVTRAGGEKEAQVLEAEGRLEASKRDGEAQVILANASKEAIEKVTSSIGANELPVMYLLGERYIQSIQHLAESDNSKTVVYPADLAETVRGFLKTK